MTDQQHSSNFAFLVGKRIESVRYMTQDEADAFMWDKRPLVIRFTDGSFLIPQTDDEGNEGGAMFHQLNGNETIIYTL
jgi:hypothetical protein